jgi:hypothetical protein
VLEVASPVDPLLVAASVAELAVVLRAVPLTLVESTIPKL